MLAQIAYSAAYGGSKPQDKVQKLSENQNGGGHKVYDGAEDQSSPSSLNIQSLSDEGINHLEHVERFQDTPSAFNEQNGGVINVDSQNVLRMHTIYCNG